MMACIFAVICACCVMALDSPVMIPAALILLVLICWVVLMLAIANYDRQGKNCTGAKAKKTEADFKGGQIWKQGKRDRGSRR